MSDAAGRYKPAGKLDAVRRNAAEIRKLAVANGPRHVPHLAALAKHSAALAGLEAAVVPAEAQVRLSAAHDGYAAVFAWIQAAEVHSREARLTKIAPAQAAPMAPLDASPPSMMRDDPAFLQTPVPHHHGHDVVHGLRARKERRAMGDRRCERRRKRGGYRYDELHRRLLRTRKTQDERTAHLGSRVQWN